MGLIHRPNEGQNNEEKGRRLDRIETKLLDSATCHKTRGVRCLDEDKAEEYFGVFNNHE